MSIASPNIFKWAPSELSHSAFWAWVLSSADPRLGNAPPDARALANAFIEEAGLDVPRESIEVETEVKAGRGRLDIAVVIDQKALLVIENKVSALPDTVQLDRYQQHVPDPAMTQRALVLLSTSFDEDIRHMIPSGWTHVRAPAIGRMVQALEARHPYIADYKEWLGALIRAAEANRAHAVSGAPEKVTAALGTVDGQWALLKEVSRSMRGVQYRGTNMGGTPWTQFVFSKSTHETDALFYRIDGSGNWAELSLKQYQPQPMPSLDHKRQRLRKLRQLWSEAAGAVGSSLKGSDCPNRGEKESYVARYLIPENLPQQLIYELPRIHHGFRDRVLEFGLAIEAKDLSELHDGKGVLNEADVGH